MATDADALVAGAFQGPDGPVLTLGTDETDLMAALTALGATGKAEEITKIPTSGQLATPVVVTVGLGPEPAADAGPADRQAYLERLRRAAGAATRDLASGKAKRIAIALPAGRGGRGRGGGARRPARWLRLQEVPDRHERVR